MSDLSEDEFSSAELMQASSEDKLCCIIDGLSDLNKFHQNGFVHGDIKPANFILDLKKLSMKLIDFGGSRKFGAKIRVAFSMLYLDPYTEIHDNHFRMDIYSMGIVIMSVYENLYGPYPYKDENDKSIAVEQLNHYRKFYQEHLVIKTSNLTLIERGMIQLVNCMMNSDASSRCNSEDALQYCQALFSRRHQLDENLLEKITKSTIHRTDVTLEDTFRDSIRRRLTAV